MTISFEIPRQETVVFFAWLVISGVFCWMANSNFSRNCLHDIGMVNILIEVGTILMAAVYVIEFLPPMAYEIPVKIAVFPPFVWLSIVHISHTNYASLVFAITDRVIWGSFVYYCAPRLSNRVYMHYIKHAAGSRPRDRLVLELELLKFPDKTREMLEQLHTASIDTLDMEELLYQPDITIFFDVLRLLEQNTTIHTLTMGHACVKAPSDSMNEAVFVCLKLGIGLSKSITTIDFGDCKFEPEAIRQLFTAIKGSTYLVNITISLLKTAIRPCGT